MPDGPENFRPRIVATFRPHQLEQVRQWTAANVQEIPGLSQTEAFKQALLVTEKDEREQPLDEKGRRRLWLGILAYTLYRKEVIVGGKILQGEIRVWQQSADEADTRLDCRFLNPALQRLPHNRYRYPEDH